MREGQMNVSEGASLLPAPTPCVTPGMILLFPEGSTIPSSITPTLAGFGFGKKADISESTKIQKSPVTECMFASRACAVRPFEALLLAASSNEKAHPLRAMAVHLRDIFPRSGQNSSRLLSLE
ncbi:hypothetical protein TNCV_26141 [Trichonephila clavipes]|uniref:Uncharacterized protein n=1 Tax=Trichonephila clavipes TaxID=2585209 RepID=A0A8X7BDG2_TRICX|nr:hypothetical protein TNCV_26141 [Trichonephila clavipes]